MQHEVTVRQKLLDKNGLIVEPGWAKEQVWEYHTKDIKASKLRIKEWDYYLIRSKDISVAFTILDGGYIGEASISYIDTSNNPWEKTNTKIVAFPMGKFHMGETSDMGNASYIQKSRKVTLVYDVKDGKRNIKCHYKHFNGNDDFDCDITLDQPKMESMCIATPWKEVPTAFYYNQKIATMPASGYVSLGSKQIEFDPSKDTGILDWGRGRWTYKNIWYWGIASGYLDSVPFGFNLGYGFSDRSSATENIIYYDHKVHKLEDVEFQIPKKSDKELDYDYYKQWKITSSDGRFEGVIDPILDRNANIKVLFIQSLQHQILGEFTGSVILDDGTKLEVNKFPVSFEVVKNKY